MDTATFQQTPVKESISKTNTCPVNSYNEWDPLEEIIVGSLEGAVIPSYHIAVTYNLPPNTARLYRLFSGRRYPKFLLKKAQQELDEFIHILEAEGVTVKRPTPIDGSRRYKTPMAWRSRYFETDAYRPLFKEYFQQGAKWTAAPKPQLLDELYDYKFKPPQKKEPIRYVINEFEPVFDAADFARCGRDLFVTKSNVTNEAGITWLRRHLGDKYRIHEIESDCPTVQQICRKLKFVITKLKALLQG
jgi:glycine amidinotransferase